MASMVTPVGAGVLALVVDDDRHAPGMAARDPADCNGDEAGPEPGGDAARDLAPPLPLPTDSPEAVMPATLFAATLLGQRMQDFARAAAHLHHNRKRTWTPPDSPLHLRDRAV
jgi:hypothetical protein